MFCFKCGKEIQDGMAFCPYCGVQLNQVSTAENKSVSNIPDGFLDNLVSLNDLVLQVENKQYGIDLCNSLLNESAAKVGLKTLRDVTIGTLTGGFVGGLLGYSTAGSSAISSAKIKKELKNNYNIDGIGSSAYKKGIENLQNDIRGIISNNIELFKMIPTRYLSSLCIDYLITMIGEKRANTINDAYDRLDTQLHNWIVENKLADIDSTISYWRFYNIYII